jgi:hypothetical protein
MSSSHNLVEELSIVDSENSGDEKKSSSAFLSVVLRELK